MATKKAVKTLRIPQRTCVGCRQSLEKRNLIRLVRTSEGVKVDLTGKINGRGAYLHDQRSCWEKGLKGALSAALKTEISAADLNSLRQYMETLPSTGPNPAEESSSGLL
ncbi:MAG TPA: YlxR family protein [Anaerolineaceae bacterium]|nr:YlxR family protein [Anaerolineaceae bacterium]